MNVKVFPATSSTEPSNKLITEYNLINIVNRLTDKDSFVVSYSQTPETGTPTSRYIVFNIHGYYFDIALNNLDGDLLKSDDLYAGIQINKSTEDSVYDVINITEGNSQGLILQQTPITGEDTYSLQLLAGGQVPPESKIKFTTGTDSRSISIDDGDLDDPIR